MSQALREHIEKVVPLTDDEFAFVMRHFIAKKYKKHQFLIQEGDKVPFNFYVVTGLLKLVYTDAIAKQHILAFAMEDWWESDMLAYYTQTAATMSLECVEDTEVLCLSLNDYRTLCAAMPKIEHFFLEKTIFSYIAAQRRILALMTASAQERYEQLLKQRPALLQRVPKTLLAAYLGVTRETLSRLT
ncbi:Crp/Fnr family transcriptional regulator [Mucilaginibacter sp. UR6-1]|uniref:Crp/Fnr family transcriptional regulator n=1 Tax=Mucilaginibacter sp. UR6-1 TaxID=1435643 RepID=UPI001E2EF5F8|nr:Crp/Fnr family transcriptional regulator [Mucilaginibacter sp. UR6-1]MCC8409807.1 Crp/Fnr family transcriptional regulator [Mucilaginibacter sp. UR6-1]